MRSNLRILNVEDDIADAELNQAMISARWPETDLVRVDTLDSFVEELKRGGFDLILSDYTMPAFDGRQALEFARKLRPDVPFLFVSGTIGEDWAIEALKNGATDYVLKHRLVRLIPAVDRALRDVAERAERVRAEEAMRESEQKYRALFESLGDAAFLVDEATGKILDTNRSASIMLGCERGQILGRRESQFFTPSCAEAESGAASDRKEAQTVQVCELQRADGKRIPVRMRTSRLALYDRPMMIRLCHELDDHGRAEA